VKKQAEDNTKLNTSRSWSLKQSRADEKDNHQKGNHGQSDKTIVKWPRIEEIFCGRKNDPRDKTSENKNGQTDRPNLLIKIPEMFADNFANNRF